MSTMFADSVTEAIHDERAAREWHIHTVREPVAATRLVDRLTEWYAGFAENTFPWDVAVFCRVNLDGSSDFVFSPALCDRAPALPRQLAARPCVQPSFADGVALLVGDVRAVALLRGRTAVEHP